MLENENVDLSRYEVVRQDFVAGQQDIQFNFGRGRAYINAFGLQLFPDCDYIQILVEKEEKKLVIKPSATQIKDSFKWCTSGKKRKPRHMGCRPLYYLIYTMMNWNMDCRYRITGEKQTAGNERILTFDLKEAICFAPTQEVREDGRVIYQQSYPKEWEMRFGIEKALYDTDEFIETYDEERVFTVDLKTNQRNIDKMNNGKVEVDDE